MWLTGSTPCRKRLCRPHGGGRSGRGRPHRRSWWGQSNNYPLVSGTGGGGKRMRELLANKYKRDQIHSPRRTQGSQTPAGIRRPGHRPGRCLDPSPSVTPIPGRRPSRFPRLAPSATCCQPATPHSRSIVSHIRTPMPVALSRIPTLRELYKSGVLKAVADTVQVRHTPKSTLLDRISL